MRIVGVGSWEGADGCLIWARHPDPASSVGPYPGASPSPRTAHRRGRLEIAFVGIQKKPPPHYYMGRRAATEETVSQGCNCAR
jgi:hypothetical protein